MILPLSFEMPYPPSVNTYWRRVGPRTIVSKKGRQYRETAQAYIRSMQLGGCIDFPIWMKLEVYPPDKRRRDIDNILKALLDSMSKRDTFHGLYKDDSLIGALIIYRREPLRPHGLVNVTVGELDGTEGLPTEGSG